MVSLKKEDLPEYTYNDYQLWEGEWELIVGIPYSMAPAPVKKHQKLLGYIFSEITSNMDECPDCEVLIDEDWKVDTKTVLKPDVSSRGEGIFLIKKESEEIYSLLDYFSRKYGQGLFLLQEFVNSPEGDYRVLVINDEVIGAVRRKLPGKTSRITTNSYQGGQMVKYEAEQLAEAAVVVSKHLISGFYALDFVKQDDHFLLLEVNSCPGWTSFEETTNIPVATPLVNFLSSLV